MTTAIVLIAHGSRESAANADTTWAAEALRRRGKYSIVAPAFLELAEPDIDAAAVTCVQHGATSVVLLPYFLSAGVHVRRDLAAARKRLSERFTRVKFVLAEPLGRHDLLIDVLAERAARALVTDRGTAPIKVFYLHWNEAELRDRIAPLKQAGYIVSSHSSTDSHPSLKDELPDIAVLSLDRLPSHSREIAEWLWEAKKRQHIPIVFVGGVPDKIAATKKKFPKARYCGTAELPRILAGLERARMKTEE